MTIRTAGAAVPTWFIPAWFRSLGGERTGLHAQQIPVHDVIERGSQAAMVVILQRYESEGLQNAIGHLPHRGENFGHAVHRAGLRLKSYFDEVALSQGMGQLQQATSHGNRLEFSFCAPAVFKTDRSQDGIAKLDPGRAPRRVRLGEVGHSLMTMASVGIE
jgi:hypothetical protein